MNCTICGKKIVLVPSAQERSKKYGMPPSHYTNLFTTHSDCLVQKRNQEATKLLTSQNKSV